MTTAEQNDARHDAAMELVGVIRAILDGRGCAEPNRHETDGRVTITLHGSTYALLSESFNRATAIRGAAV